MVKRIFESCYCVDYIDQVDKITFLSAHLWLLSMTREFSKARWYMPLFLQSFCVAVTAIMTLLNKA
jgi:hypothetical protein